MGVLSMPIEQGGWAGLSILTVFQCRLRTVSGNSPSARMISGRGFKWSQKVVRVGYDYQGESSSAGSR